MGKSIQTAGYNDVCTVFVFLNAWMLIAQVSVLIFNTSFFYMSCSKNGSEDFVLDIFAHFLPILVGTLEPPSLKNHYKKYIACCSSLGRSK